MSQYKNKDLTIIIVIYNSTDKIIDLLQQLNNFEIIKSVNKKKGIFEKFFNYFSK